MINIFKSNGSVLARVKSITPDTWVDLVHPSAAEVDLVVKETGIDRNLIEKMHDENELPRVEKEADATMIVVDTPARDEGDDDEYITFPLGIIISDRGYVVTISSRNATVLRDFRRGAVKDFQTAKKTRFLIQIMTKIAADYMKILNTVYRQIEKKEDRLSRSTSNKDLMELLATEKTLVYFTTSLKENVMVLEKLASGTALQLFEGDTDLLEDALIENRQAVDMANIYSGILSSLSGTYATVVSNNLNDVMKFFAGITIVLEVPNVISGFLGMNVSFGSFSDNPFSWVDILVLSIAACVLIYLWLRKKGHL